MRSVLTAAALRVKIYRGPTYGIQTSVFLLTSLLRPFVVAVGACLPTIPTTQRPNWFGAVARKTPVEILGEAIDPDLTSSDRWMFTGEVYCRSRFSQSRRYLNSLLARNACLPPRSLTFLPPRNSHFDQFEFFAGAATVDFTTSSRLHRLLLLLLLFVVSRGLSLSLSFADYPPRPPLSLSLSLRSLRAHTYAYIKSYLPSHVLLPSGPTDSHRSPRSRASVTSGLATRRDAAR